MAMRFLPLFWVLLALWHCHHAQAIVTVTTTINNGSLAVTMSHGTKCAKGAMSVQVVGPGMSSVCPAAVAASKPNCKSRVQGGSGRAGGLWGVPRKGRVPRVAGGG